jgi:hypothetical protein
MHSVAKPAQHRACYPKPVDGIVTRHNPFSNLRKRMAPGRRARNAGASRRMLADMTLHELRQARERSQEDLARELKINQPAAAKLGDTSESGRGGS